MMSLGHQNPSVERFLRELRQHYIATWQAPTEAPEPRQVLELVCGGEAFGMPLDQLRLLERVPILVPLPAAPSVLVGVAAMRGRILAVFDLGRLMGRGEVDRNRLSARLFTLRANENLGLLVDAVSGFLLPDQVPIDLPVLEPAGILAEIVAALERRSA